MRIAIVQFPGSNCERETSLAVKRAGMTPVPFLWNEPPERLDTMDGYIIVGGFSWEDRSRAGIIAARHPVMSALKQQSVSGKPILGICNGAQILLESGLVPGNGLNVALTDNKRMSQGQVLGTGYYNAWIQMKTGSTLKQNAFTRGLTQNECLRIPVAHAEGRFLANAETVSELAAQGLIAFQYCDADGQIIDSFPVNPNGSVHNIAALINPAGNVMAIMPHPERTPIGDALFHSMREYISANAPTDALLCRPERSEGAPLVGTEPQSGNPSLRSGRHDGFPCHGLSDPESHTLLVELVIADNQALSVQNSLRQAGLNVNIKRQIWWNIHCKSPEVLQQIQASGVLYNDRKSFLATHQAKANQRSLLVRPKEDLQGLQKKQQLNHHFAIHDVQDIQRGVLWHIEAASAEELDASVHDILQSSILFNPVSHECYDYV